jgi:transposase
VLDVPAKPSAQVRVFATGNGRKTDPVDAHSVAIATLHAANLNRVQVDADLAVLGMLADRRDELNRARTQTINRLHRLLLELFPDGAQKFLSTTQARTLIATIKPRDLVGKTRRRLTVELIGELTSIDRKVKDADKELRQLITDRGSTLTDLHGIRPSSAARLLADVANIHRFRDRDRFASWNGTAPIDASSGEQQRHRLSPAGNRRINRVLHITAVMQLRNPTEGRAFFDAKKPPERPQWKQCAHSNDSYPTSSTRVCSPTRNSAKRQARKGTRGRPCNPARPAQPPTPALRTSHSPNPPPTA